MHFGFSFRPGQMDVIRGASTLAPLGFLNRQFNTGSGGTGSVVGNAIDQVTGGRRPHQVIAVVSGGVVALTAQTTVFNAENDDPAASVGSMFDAVMGGTLPYQVTAVATA